MNEKADPFKHKQRWNEWKKKKCLYTRYGNNSLSLINKDLIIEYLLDMEAGYNVGRKGRRSYIRLNTIRQRITWILENMGIDDITKAARRQVLDFFNKMGSGAVRRKDGKKYNSTIDYINIFKAFWHWYQKKERENDNIVKDITIDLDTANKKENEFVYFRIDDLRKVINRCKYEYRVYLWFLFDSGIRSPTEFLSLKNKDFHWLEDKQIYELDIKDEYAKTFGRKIKLILSSDLIKEFLREKNPDESFFNMDWQSFTKYIKRVFVKALGNKTTMAGKKIKEIRPYDFRHSSACYWLIRYKNESAFKYRFGWKENKMIHYYTKLLGMKDTITQEDILVDSDAKSRLEKELERQKKHNALIEDKLKAQDNQMERINKILASIQIDQRILDKQKAVSL